MEVVQTRCCIAGGGPCGMILGYLLARAGVDTVVLEKHADFLRDFRGDTIHPSTLQVLYELGILPAFLERPHQEVTELRGVVGGMEVPIADFSHLPTHCRFLALMPQWDFLDFLADEARQYPTFHLRMQSGVEELTYEGDQIVGVRGQSADGPFEIRAALVVGADGRASTVRAQAGLTVEEFGSPIDVLWMRLSRHESDPDMPMGRFDQGRILVMIYRGDYWQCGYIIPKGGHAELQARGIEAFRAELVSIAPFLEGRVNELQSWNDIKLLTVKIDRLNQWYRSGLLCLGDAAHAMSPVGGVGINLAIQDAVAAANHLAGPLAAGRLTEDTLRQVQRRRMFPTRLTQWMQVQIQDNIIGRVLSTEQSITPPLPLQLLKRFEVLRRIPARLVGVGVRPEHVETPDVFSR